MLIIRYGKKYISWGKLKLQKKKLKAKFLIK